MEIGIRELRDGLSRHLDVVREGGTITVTDHGEKPGTTFLVRLPSL